ncbi:Protein of unknown function DUF761, plant protein [Actinidia chinensis var. chinensis]|uniref:Uncharacterized protein n=1 Tax=Actinidia chinensis var. chinensis TaxID=1590841 RepID=A0A2R6QUA7_ACTCC|nr:Protein of unknown function DUF761, plant protein [Actinidia chinensis var. chinensis]
MQKKKSGVTHKAWNLLRIALLWARKGGVFKRRLVIDLRLFPKFLKTLGHSNQHGALRYGDRELSFDETPIINVKMHRPSSLRFRIPCLNQPQVDFDYNFDFDDDAASYCDYGARKSFLRSGDDDCEICEEEIDHCEGDEGIDLKAEQFISKFYEQMKLQRQVSYLQYSEMLSRGTS